MDDRPTYNGLTGSSTANWNYCTSCGIWFIGYHECHGSTQHHTPWQPSVIQYAIPDPEIKALLQLIADKLDKLNEILANRK